MNNLRQLFERLSYFLGSIIMFIVKAIIVLLGAYVILHFLQKYW